MPSGENESRFWELRNWCRNYKKIVVDIFGWYPIAYGLIL